MSKTRFTKLLSVSLLVALELGATEPFTLDALKSHLTQDNPYINAAFGRQKIAKEQLNATEGLFDTKIVAKIEEKSYPDTTATYESAGLERATEFGVDLSAGYRYASGTQEYNNIKTGKEGELIAGAKIPLVTFLSGIDERRLRVGLLERDLTKSTLMYKEALRAFYFKVMSEYYLLLYAKELLALDAAMLEKIEKRYDYLASNVQKGNLAKIALIEASQQQINAKQSLLRSKREFQNAQNRLLGLLNIDTKSWSKRYHLPAFEVAFEPLEPYELSLKKALLSRADLGLFETEIEKVLLQNQNNETKKYPQTNIGLYGVQDNLTHESGAKVTLDVAFPIALSEYRAKSAELKESIKTIKSEQDARYIELEVDLKNVYNSLEVTQTNLQAAKEELSLLLRLEEAENKKYLLGASSLFLLNQREMITLGAQRKIASYKLEYALLLESYKRITASHKHQE